jgi:hypothetical protein
VTTRDVQTQSASDLGYPLLAALILAGAAAPVLLAATGVPGQSQAANLIGSAAFALLLAAGAWACLGGSLRRDPARFATTAGPVLGASVVLVVVALAGGFAEWAAVAGYVWLLGWSLAGSTMWPAWSRHVLRRPPDPEDEFGSRWRAYRALLRSDAPMEQAIDALVAMGTDATPRMTPLVDTWWVAQDIWRFRDADARSARLWDRQGELLEEWNASICRSPDPPEAPWPNPARPTEGSMLELGFPELEALVAIATPAEQRRLAVAAARHTLATSGLLDEQLRDALVMAADGHIDEGAVAALAAADEADGTQLEPIPEDGPGRDAELARRRRLIARGAARMALEEDLAPTTAASTVYGAARLCDDDELEELRHALAVELPVDRLAAARPVDVDRGRLEANRAARARREAVAWPVARDVPLWAAALLGAAAGTGGTAVRAAVWTLMGGGGDVDAAVSTSAGWLAAFAIAWTVLAAVGRRPRPDATFYLYLAVAFAESFEIFLSPGFNAAVQQFAPEVWTGVFKYRTSALPYAPLHGVALAIVMTVIAWWPRRRGQR